MRLLCAFLLFLIVSFVAVVWSGVGGVYLVIGSDGKVDTAGIGSVVFDQPLSFNDILRKQAGASFLQWDVDATTGPIMSSSCDGNDCPTIVEALGTKPITFRTANVDRAYITSTGQLQGIPVKASLVIDNPRIGDSGFSPFEWPNNVTLLEIACFTDVGTLSINFAERTRASPHTGGTNSLSTALVCASTYAVATTFADATILADAPYTLIITAETGSPTVVSIFIKALRNL